MVKLKDHTYLLPDGSVNIEGWLQHVATHRTPTELHLIRRALHLSQLTGAESETSYGTPCLQQGLAMAEILFDLNLDLETIAAAIVYNNVHYADLSLEDVTEHLGEPVTKIVQGVERMEAIRSLHGHPQRGRTQTENLRKMLLAMVEDIRVVLIKLSERTCLMRTANTLPEEMRQHLARETMDIYAPLANRLGVGQIKWELEDLSFRYLEPQAYKTLAKLLDQKRVDRERFIERVVNEIKKGIQDAGIKGAEVNGRAKHIYSIYRKMQKKDLDYHKIYDISAVRVLTKTIEDCYGVLSIVQSHWQQIPAEFDDYIATPKPNGYRSIHTAVIGPDNRNVEVQIRTYDMHQESELGVAAHWRYKEGGKQESSYENKIAWLRQVLEWQRELTEESNTTSKSHAGIFADRVYVFTPDGDIVDLPKGSTPLDFAYHIHSEVGHRCRGAKINHAIVPLTYTLNTGDQVEILTTREPAPSRDWLNPHLGYLHTARAKAKIHHWFKLQDFDHNLDIGKSLIERELRRLELSGVDYDKIAGKLHFNSGDDLLAALGCGDVRVSQVLNLIQPPPESAKKVSEIAVTTPSEKSPRGIHIQGVGDLVTHTAKCCKPLPGDDIIGFITVGHGVSIHRQDCVNILHAHQSHESRLIEVSWSMEAEGVYPVDIAVSALDRQGLARDITTLISNEKLNLLGFTSHVDKDRNIAHILLTVEIKGLGSLSKILDRIQQVPNVIDVKRQSPR